MEENVLLKEVDGYVTESIILKQNIQKNPTISSKYQSKTPFIRVYSNAVKWMTIDDKIELYKMMFGPDGFETKIVGEIIKKLKSESTNGEIIINIHPIYTEFVSKLKGIIIENKFFNSYEKKSFIAKSAPNKSADIYYTPSDAAATQSFDDNIIYTDNIDTDTIIINNNDAFIGNFIENYLGGNPYINSVEFFTSPSSNNIGSTYEESAVKEKLKKVYAKSYTGKQSENLGFYYELKSDLYNKSVNNIIKKDIKGIKGKENTVSDSYLFLKIKISKPKSEDSGSGYPHAINRNIPGISISTNKPDLNNKDIFNFHVNELKISNEYRYSKDYLIAAILKSDFDKFVLSHKESIFKLSEDTLIDVKLLQLLYDIVINDRIVSVKDLKDSYKLNPEDHESITRILGSTSNVKYAKNHILDSIDTPSGSRYDGGFFIFEKDGKIRNEESGSSKDTETKHILSGLGYRPKAGVVSFSVESQGNVGMLRRAVLNLKAHNLEQLEMIQKLYMRPGIFLFTEWGWSTCPTSGSTSTEIKLTQNNTVTSFFDTNAPNELYKLFSSCDDKRKESKCHYDFMFGLISNFEWTMDDSGGFDIKINLTSSTTSLLTMQMANNNSNRESSYSLNIFSKFKGYFNVLGGKDGENKNFSKLSTHEYIKNHENELPFYYFKDVNTKPSEVTVVKTTSTGGGSGSSNKPHSEFYPWSKISSELKRLVKVLNSNSKYSVILNGDLFPFRNDNGVEIDEKFKSNSVEINESNNLFLWVGLYNSIKGGAGPFSKDDIGSYLSDNNYRYIDGKIYLRIPKHYYKIRFPLINELKKDKHNFDDNIYIEYLKTQGIGGLDGFLNMPGTIFNSNKIRLLLSNDYKEYNKDGMTHQPLILQIKEALTNKSKATDKFIYFKGEERKEISELEKMTYKDMNDRFYGSLANYYKSQYQNFINKIYKSIDLTYSNKDSMFNYITIKNKLYTISKNNGDNLVYNYTALVKWFLFLTRGSDKIKNIDILTKIIENPYYAFEKYETYELKIEKDSSTNYRKYFISFKSNPPLSARTSKEPVPSDFVIGSQAYSGIFKLYYYNTSYFKYINGWKNFTLNQEKYPQIYIGNKYVNLDPKSVDPLESNSDQSYSFDGGSSSTIETETVKKIEYMGGLKPYYITFKFLLSLLNDSILKRNDIKEIQVPLDATEKNKNYLSGNISGANDEVMKLINEIKNKTDNSDSYKKKEIQQIIEEYNSSVRNLKNGLFYGIDFYTPIETTKIHNTSAVAGVTPTVGLTSIKQSDIIFLTKKIVAEYMKDIPSTTSNDFKINIKDLALDNDIKNQPSDKNNLLESCYISCRYINELIGSSNTLDAFLKSIFNDIYEASGGVIDLIIKEEESKSIDSTSKKTGYKLKIYDRKYNNNPKKNSDTDKEVFVFSAMSNNSIISQLSLSGKLPTSFQRVAFVASSPIPGEASKGSSSVNSILNSFSGGFVNNIDKIKYIGNSEEYVDNDEDLTYQANIKTLNELSKTPLNYGLILDNNEFNSYYSNYINNIHEINKALNEVSSSYEFKIREAALNEKKPFKPARQLIQPVGLDLSFKIDGTSGLNWGDLVSVDYLPEQLKNSGFQITKIVDDISGDSWSTSISTVLRFIDRDRE